METIFSREFSKSIFGKKPAELKPDKFCIDEKEIFNALFAYKNNINEIISKNFAADFITAIDRKISPKPQSDMLVSDKDKDLDHYIQRLNSDLAEKEWCIAYFGLHTVNAVIWDKLKEFADRLGESLGYRPAGRVDIDLFIGKYKATHTGIHYDNAHNFAITLRGHKKMYTWEYNNSHLIGLKYPDYEMYKKDSIVINNKPDRICYFPHDALHVAESDDNISVVFNIAFWENSEKPKNILSFLQNNIIFNPQQRVLCTKSGRVYFNDQELISQIKNRLIEEKELHKFINQYDLMQNTCSHLNLSRPISTENISFNMKESISLRENSILQWIIDEESNEIIISSNGHAATLAYDKKIIFLLEMLSYRYNVKLSDYSKYMPIFELLKKWGALC